MSKSLEGSWSLILGASSGMGRATARVLAREGCNVIGLHLDTALMQESVDALVTELEAEGVKAHFFNANAANSKVREELVPQFVEIVGDAGLKLVLHSLAFGSLGPFLPITESEKPITSRQMDMTLNVMAHSLVYWVQDLHAADMLRQGSKIFAMTSAGDQKVSSNYGAVSAAKCALESHVRQLALELASSGVAVNSLRAGVTRTPSLERIPEHEELIARALHANPHQRLTEPDDIAEAITLMTSSRSSWMTGNVIGVDGGEMLTS